LAADRPIARSSASDAPAIAVAASRSPMKALQAPEDRGGRAGRDLLADDRAGERSEIVERPARAPARHVDRLEAVDQACKHRVGGAQGLNGRRRVKARHRSPEVHLSMPARRRIAASRPARVSLVSGSSERLLHSTSGLDAAARFSIHPVSLPELYPALAAP